MGEVELPFPLADSLKLLAVIVEKMIPGIGIRIAFEQREDIHAVDFVFRQRGPGYGGQCRQHIHRGGYLAANCSFGNLENYTEENQLQREDFWNLFLLSAKLSSSLSFTYRSTCTFYLLTLKKEKKSQLTLVDSL